MIILTYANDRIVKVILSIMFMKKNRADHTSNIQTFPPLITKRCEEFSFIFPSSSSQEFCERLFPLQIGWEK